MVRYLFYTIGDLTYQSPLVCHDRPVYLNKIRVFTYLEMVADFTLFVTYWKRKWGRSGNYICSQFP